MKKPWLLLLVFACAIGVVLLYLSSERGDARGASNDGASAAPSVQPSASAESAGAVAQRAPLEPPEPSPLVIAEPDSSASNTAPVASAPAAPAPAKPQARVQNDPELFARKYRGVDLEGLAVAKFRVHKALDEAQQAAFDATYDAGDYTTEVLQPEEIPDIETAMKNAERFSDGLNHSIRATRHPDGRLERRRATLDPVKYAGVYLLSDELGWINVAMSKFK